jgi:hypothetical protein
MSYAMKTDRQAGRQIDLLPVSKAKLNHTHGETDLPTSYRSTPSKSALIKKGPNVFIGFFGFFGGSARNMGHRGLPVYIYIYIYICILIH